MNMKTSLKIMGFCALHFTFCAMFISCVSMKEYNDLKNDYESLRKKSNDLIDENQKKSVDLNELRGNYKQQSTKLSELQSKFDNLENEYKQNFQELEYLRKDYDELNDRYLSNLSGKTKENAELLKQLQAAKDDLNRRESDLAEKEKNLAALSATIKDKEQKVNELQAMLDAKNKELNELKDKMLNALVGFKDKGLSVEIKDGKVYVSMSEKLLFASGKWDVSAQGKAAIREIANVIANHPDLDILIEGHTDNVPMKGLGDVKDNLDLSVMRATSITKILLENKKIDALRVTSAGRGEYMPLVSNNSVDNKAKNRRAEIILTPKINEIIKQLSK
jgi:chemotaxis protein MotB